MPLWNKFDSLFSLQPIRCGWYIYINCHFATTYFHFSLAGMDQWAGVEGLEDVEEQQQHRRLNSRWSLPLSWHVTNVTTLAVLHRHLATHPSLPPPLPSLPALPSSADATCDHLVHATTTWGFPLLPAQTAATASSRTPPPHATYLCHLRTQTAPMTYGYIRPPKPCSSSSWRPLRVQPHQYCCRMVRMGKKEDEDGTKVEEKNRSRLPKTIKWKRINSKQSKMANARVIFSKRCQIIN